MLGKGVHNLFCVQIVQVGEQFVKVNFQFLVGAWGDLWERGHARR